MISTKYHIYNTNFDCWMKRRKISVLPWLITTGDERKAFHSVLRMFAAAPNFRWTDEHAVVCTACATKCSFRFPLNSVGAVALPCAPVWTLNRTLALSGHHTIIMNVEHWYSIQDRQKRGGWRGLSRHTLSRTVTFEPHYYAYILINTPIVCSVSTYDRFRELRSSAEMIFSATVLCQRR